MHIKSRYLNKHIRLKFASRGECLEEYHVSKVSTFLCVCMCVYMWSYACTWKAEDKLKCCSSLGTIHPDVWNKFTHLPEPPQLAEAGGQWTQGSSYLSLPAPELQEFHDAWRFNLVLGIELRSSWLHSKHYQPCYLLSPQAISL